MRAKRNLERPAQSTGPSEAHVANPNARRPMPPTQIRAALDKEGIVQYVIGPRE